MLTLAEDPLSITCIVVDTESGLKIVKAIERNFWSDYAVQFAGTMEECEREKARLEKLAH